MPPDAIERASTPPKAPEPAPAPEVKRPRMLKLHMCAVKDAVPFGGPSDMTLLMAYGELELDLIQRVVIAKPRAPGKEEIVIPLENVRFCVPLTERHVKKLEATGQKAVMKPVVPRLPPQKGDTVKFIRGPDGKPMEVIE